MVHGSRSPAVPVPLPSCRRRVPSTEHPGNREADPARRFPKRTSFLLDVSEFFGEFRRSLADFQPIEEGIRRFQPDAEPFSDLFLFLAFARFHFAVMRDHLRATFAQSRNLSHAFHGRGLSMGFEA